MPVSDYADWAVPAKPEHEPAMARTIAHSDDRIARADELLARLIDDIGTGPAFDRLRKDAQRIKNVLRGLDW